MSGQFNFNLNASNFSFNPNASGFSPSPAPETTSDTSSPKTETTTTTTTTKKNKNNSKSEVAPAPETAPEPQITNVEEPEDIPWVDSDSSGDAEDFKEHVNICFIGHVDHGKSTISGNILLQTGMVDQRTIDKYVKEAQDNGRDSWFLAFIVDTEQDERAKGKTVEVGRAHFNTSVKRYTILDAPGHKDYVPNMIQGVSQADVAILITSARSGEFEAGFDKNGQTCEHAMLAKTVGVRNLIVAVNKMDEETVQWNQERFNDIQERLGTFLRGTGFKNVQFIPISGYTGANLVNTVEPDVCSWYTGPSLIQTLDSMAPIPRMNKSALRIPVLDKYRDRGHTVVLGKVESGTIRKNHELRIAPGYGSFGISILEDDDKEVQKVKGGENIKILLKSSQISEDDIQPGFVIYRKDRGPSVTTEIVAQIVTMKLGPNQLFTSAFSAVMHIHTCVAEVTVVSLLEQKNIKTGERMKLNPPFVASRSMVIAHLRIERPIAVERYSDFAQLGRFTLRDEGRTIAFGTVLATHAPKKRTK